MNANEIQKNDVVRTRRYGRKTRANYVIDRVIELKLDGSRVIAVEAHREYGGQSGKFMLLHIDGATILRNYR